MGRREARRLRLTPRELIQHVARDLPGEDVVELQPPDPLAASRRDDFALAARHMDDHAGAVETPLDGLRTRRANIVMATPRASLSRKS